MYGVTYNLRTCDDAKNVLSSYVYVFILLVAASFALSVSLSLSFHDKLVPSIVSIGDYSRVRCTRLTCRIYNFIYRSGKGKLGSRKWKLDQSDGFFVQFESPAAVRKIWFVTGTKEKQPSLWSTALLSYLSLDHEILFGRGELTILSVAVYA